MTIDKLMMRPNELDIVEEISIFRSIEIAEASRNRVCLFGKPDRNDTEMMLAQEFEMDRKRFMDNWGFDILCSDPAKKRRERRSPKKTKSEDKENVEITLLRSNLALSDISFKSKRNKENKRPEYVSPKKSLKMTGEKSYLKNGRQSQMTDYWNYRKLSESSCSDKEN